ncbi:MAG TPA: anti-sigma factor [Vicinamibacterales bacterium]
MQEQLNLPKPGTDSREPDLQGQIDGLRSALRDWQRTREYSQPTQKRLEQLTVQCAQLVDSWQQTQRRRNGGLAGERGAGGLETLHQSTGERIRALERAIEQEWESLPAGGSDPGRQISEQAVSLVESCVTATNLALRGFANAESRVSALEREIQAGMTQLSRDLQLVLTELRALRQSGLPPAPAAFPLEGVMRIHQEMRDAAPDPAVSQRALEAPADATPPPGLPDIETAEASAPAADESPIDEPAAPPAPASGTASIETAPADTADPATPVTEAAPAASAAADSSPVEAAPPPVSPDVPQIAAALSARVESLERVVEDVAHRDTVQPSRLRPWLAAAGVFALVGAIALFGLWLQRRVDERLNDAALRVSAAERERDAAIDATRQEAARQVADARQSATQAQIVGNVLAAPDLVRYWLRGASPDSPAYGHILFSRTRGLVFSASRLAPAESGRTYQLWLSTTTGPINAGLVNPDREGRVTLATEVPLAVTGRLSGAFVTVEPEGGRTEPSSQMALVKID